MGLTGLFEMLGAFLGAFAILGAMLLIIRAALPGPEHWTKKNEKYLMDDYKFQMMEERDKKRRLDDL